MVLLQSVAVAKENERFSQASTDVLGGEGNSALVRYAKVDGELTDEIHRKLYVLHHEAIDKLHGNSADDRTFESGSTSDIVLIGKISTIAEVFHGLHHTNDLHFVAHAFLVDFHLSLHEAKKMLGEIAFHIDVLILGIALNFYVFTQLRLLLFCEQPNKIIEVLHHLRNRDCLSFYHNKLIS